MNIDNFDMCNVADDEFEDIIEHRLEQAKQHPFYTTNEQFRQMVDKIEAKVEKLQEERASEISNALMREIECDNQVKQLQTAYYNLRNILIESYNRNPPNAAALRKIILEMMQTEKDHKLYKPADWQGLQAGFE